MKSNIDKYKAKIELEKFLKKIEELKPLNYNNDEFDIWLESVNDLIEDLFSKESRQFNEFNKIKFHPNFLFLGNPSNEKYEQDSYVEGLVEAQQYLENLINYIIEYWNLQIDYENVRAIQPNTQNDDFEKLAKSIRENLENNEPEIALDRLHTYLIKYFRELNNKHGITYEKETPLHSLFGNYVKYLIKNKKLETEISPIILKYSISIFEKYNDIRNNKSFAHDNKILDYSDSKLIVNNISNLIQYINVIESKNHITSGSS